MKESGQAVMNSKELKNAIREDREYYFGVVKCIYRMLTYNPLYRRGKYIIAARKAGYYATHSQSVINKIKLFWYTRKKNKLGEKLGIELGPSEFGRRIKIYHNNIIVNAGAVIGDDCEFYGDNCIGNKGSASKPLDAPIIGDGVSFGVGVKAIGKVRIADNVRISSMSLVNKDIIEMNALYGGVPAIMIKKLR